MFSSLIKVSLAAGIVGLGFFAYSHEPLREEIEKRYYSVKKRMLGYEYIIPAGSIRIPLALSDFSSRIPYYTYYSRYA
jgi:hypothetical protein